MATERGMGKAGTADFFKVAAIVIGMLVALFAIFDGEM